VRVPLSPRGRLLAAVLVALAVPLCAAPAAQAVQPSNGGTAPVDSASSGGASPTDAHSARTGTTAKAPAARERPHGGVARLIPAGLARSPHGSPPAVRSAIRAGNLLQGLPYRYGGGHESFLDTAYDCSGAVSFTLHGARLLDAPLDSTALMSWGDAGPGVWITIYANPEHTFMVVAGLRLDTSRANDPTGQDGPRWRPAARDLEGFTVRHPPGL
jgi:cell wall-associated NlpC family hydrolase